jgi:uncharacterized lipoprotein
MIGQHSTDSSTSTLKALGVMLMLSVLVACGGRSQLLYVDSEEIEPLRVPEHLDTPDTRLTYDVPGFFLPELATRSDQGRPPQVQSSAEAEASRSQILFGSQGLFLEVQDSHDSVWRRLGFSLNRAGMRIRDLDEAAQQYQFYLDHEGIVLQRRGLERAVFWRADEVIDYSGEFVAEIVPIGEARTRVNLRNADGSLVDMDQAEYVLGVLRERLG